MRGSGSPGAQGWMRGSLIALLWGAVLVLVGAPWWGAVGVAAIIAGLDAIACEIGALRRGE